MNLLWITVREGCTITVTTFAKDTNKLYNILGVVDINIKVHVFVQYSIETFHTRVYS